jgi:hypothetical protein
MSGNRVLRRAVLVLDHEHRSIVVLESEIIPRPDRGPVAFDHVLGKKEKRTVHNVNPIWNVHAAGPNRNRVLRSLDCGPVDLIVK